MKARVCWAVRGGTVTGHGDWLDLAVALAWTALGNREYPELYHFLDLRHGAKTS